ncbi:putative metalloprotease CJM1_0395 family protein [Azospirillum sp. B4]|uniref:putative metalloprotease CJM1_0395 family protein n=1 Tax=Azospirillum sp. B4 TaxID=95605 RepID=UPI0003495BE2|nr:putative metalloprotease CJM1_0395 family protein [Azospirillum sp. B4]
MSALGGISASPFWTRALSGPAPAAASAGQGRAVASAPSTGTVQSGQAQAANPYGVRGQAAVGNGSANDSTKLTDAQQQQVDKLKTVDRSVRAHEAAHKAAGGPYAGSASYTYTTGPDGQRYAVAGEVKIDIGTVQGDPQATVAKLETVRRAALAPADPSGQDRAVAAQAEAGIVAAQGEEAKQKTGTGEDATEGPAGQVGEAGSETDDSSHAQATGTDKSTAAGATGVTSRQGVAAYRKTQGALDAGVIQAAQAATAAQPLGLVI